MRGKLNIGDTVVCYSDSECSRSGKNSINKDDNFFFFSDKSHSLI